MKNICLALLAACTIFNAQSQNTASQDAQSRDKVYFVDGYHGGVYGHYPLEWKTRFIVDQLAAHPEWRIGMEIEPETWDSVKVHTPADYEAFRRIAADQRVEFTNPSYAQPYAYNVSGESLIRQFEYGIRKTRAHFPDVEFVTYSVEEPCFTSSLPQILTGFGFKYAVLKSPNTLWGGYSAPYGGELVNWTGPDGTSILTVPRYAVEALEDNSVWQTKAWGNHSDYLAACRAAGIAHPVGMTYQDAGWKNGPWLGFGDNIRNGSIYVTWREYFEEVTDGTTDDDYHMSQEDVRPALMWGSQVLQTIARQVRATENGIVAAEKMGAMASLISNYDYPQADIDEAWRGLMLAQHHDSWIVPYNNLHGRGTWADAIGRWTRAADELAGEVTADAEKAISGTAAARASEKFLTAFNTTGTARREIVSIVTDSGKSVVTEVNVPAFGYSTIRVGDNMIVAQTEKKIAANEYVLENDTYRMVIDATRGGVITSLVAKNEGGKEYATTGEYALGELRGHFYNDGGFRSSTETPATITVTSDNAFEKSVRVEGHIAGHPFSQLITIRKGDRKIDFALEIDWQGNPAIGEFAQKDAARSNRRAFYDDRFKLNVLFPAALTSPTLYKDAPFDVTESALVDTHFQTWDAIKHNIILHWVDLVEKSAPAGSRKKSGLALLSDHTTSYSYGPDFPLALTVQFSGDGLWGRDYKIDGPSQIRFALIPHSGTWDEAEVQAESTRWNEPLICSLSDNAPPENRSMIDVAGSGYEISAAYPVEDGILVRLYNADGDAAARQIRFGFPVESISEVDLNSDTLGEVKTRERSGTTEATVAMPRFGIKTFVVTKK
ncbi:MAG: alpha-mannosidase [Alistipes sp.]|jgi:alpha-mannosidase|nr:alpha-mannosidase [Alistipes sp.]